MERERKGCLIMIISILITGTGIYVATEYESEVVREKNLITYKFYYKNIRKIANMPNTGGTGTTKGRALGFTLIIISAFILYRSRKTKGMYKRG